MAEIVKHPETGQPVRQEVNYVNVERDQLQNAVNDAQRVADEKQAQLEQVTKENEEAQAALADCKSELSAYDEIAPQPESDEGSEATSGEGEGENAEGETPVPVVQF